MKHFIRNEDGATAIEYGVILALVALAAMAGFVAVGGGTSGQNGLWGKVNTKVSNKL